MLVSLLFGKGKTRIPFKSSNKQNRIQCGTYAQTGQEEKKVEKYLSKELLQKTEENFQQTQKLQDLGNKRKQWQGGVSELAATGKGIKT